MKTYQKLWLLKIINKDSISELMDICSKIAADDTGDTDELTQALAKEILKFKVELIKGER